jgi:hypothetical protein
MTSADSFISRPRRWWHSPVCGEPHARLRYEFALTKWSDCATPLPIEIQQNFGDRQRLLRRDTSRSDTELKAIWEQFQVMYPPWRPTMGDMLPPIAANHALPVQDVSRMESLVRAGIKWTSMTACFPHHLESTLRVTYLQIASWLSQVLAAGHTNNMSYHRADSLWKQLWPELARRGYSWTADEDVVLRAMHSYGLSHFGIAEELIDRPPRPCHERKTGPLGLKD